MQNINIKTEEKTSRTTVEINANCSKLIEAFS
jgi:hypothetical protein